MGAHTFHITIGGKGMDEGKAYASACRDAQYEHGHDGYNGTISTTNGIVKFEAGKRRPENVIREILDREDSVVEKWGPAGCIEMKGAELKRWKAANGLKGTRARAFHFFGWAAS